MVRVGVKPAIKRWKDHAEIVALGFSLTLKLHDMVHSYLTASQKTSIDAETDKMWQAKIDESDYFLALLFVATFVLVVMRVLQSFLSNLRDLLEKRGCRRCLRRMFCGCKCFPLSWQKMVADERTKTKVKARDRYSVVQVGSSGGSNAVRSVESAMRAEPAGRDMPLRSGREGRHTAAAAAAAASAVGSEAAERVEYQAALKKHQQRQKANSRWNLVRTRMTSSVSMSSSSPSSTSLLSYMAAAAKEEEKEGEHGNTSARMRLRSELFDKVDQKTLKYMKALSEMVDKELKRQAEKESARSRSGGDGGAGDVEMIMVRNPSFGKASVELAQSSLHDAADVAGVMYGESSADGGVSLGESKGNDDSGIIEQGCGGNRGRGLAARNEGFFHNMREQTKKEEVKAARDKETARSQMSPEMRQEIEDAEEAAENQERERDHMNRHQMEAYNVSVGSMGRGRDQGQGKGRGGGRGRSGGGWTPRSGVRASHVGSRDVVAPVEDDLVL